MTVRFDLLPQSGKPARPGSNTFGGNTGVDLRHVTIILGGVQESGYRPGSSIERFMLTYGDVMVVRYPEKGRFRLHQFAQDILNYASDYRRITLVGISGGAKLAQEILRLARHAKRSVDDFRLILDSAPSRRKTLAPALRLPALASLVMPASLLPSSAEFSWWFYGKLNGANPFKLPKYPATLARYAKQELERHHKRTNERPAGTFIRETRALIVKAPKPNRSVLHGIEAAFIRSTNDEIVLPAAFGEWNEAIEDYDGTLHLIEVESSEHADHLSYPDEWLAAYETAFKKLGITPLIVA